MDKTLKNIYLRIDATMQTLHRKAISELLLKIIYQQSGSISFDDICKAYQKETKGAIADRVLLVSILGEMVSSNDIKTEEGRYRISTGKRKRIDKQASIFEEQIDRVIDNYIKPAFSPDQVLKEWFIDALAFFFANYSDVWISDLKDNSAAKVNIVNSKASILDALTLRTSNNKAIDERDRESLSERFLDILTKTGDSALSSVLFESGVSAFSSKLISSNIGLDAMTLDVFKDSVCILDTNILMYIGLEAGQYYQALEFISSVFASLGIRVYYLDVTEHEYIHTVVNKRDTIIKLIEKGFDIDVLSRTDDEYLKTAFARECRNVEDFERFFKDLIVLPSYLDDKETVPIIKYPADEALVTAVSEAKLNDVLKDEVNSIYKDLTKRDKRPHSLTHDAQIIAGVEEIRKKDKAFILSQDTCINEYSKKRPSVNDLTLALKLETLINVLSVYQPETMESDIFSALFASMLRDGLVPRNDVFQLEDLSVMCEREEQISQLPPQSVISIAKDICRLRLSGESDENINLALSRAVQGQKMQVAVELKSTQEQLRCVKEEKDRETKRADNRDELLKESLLDSAKKDISIEIKKKSLRCVFVAIVLVLVLLFLGIYIGEKLSIAPLIGYIIDFVMIVVGLLVASVVGRFKELLDLMRNSNRIANERADNRYKELLFNGGFTESVKKS